MSMETPKISVGMIAEQFSAMSVKSRQWYEKSLREAVLYSLVVYYEARLKSRFVPVLDPWEGMTVANYNYRLVLAEVERKLPMWVSNLPTESENASVLYAGTGLSGGLNCGREPNCVGGLPESMPSRLI